MMISQDQILEEEEDELEEEDRVAGRQRENTKVESEGSGEDDKLDSRLSLSAPKTKGEN